MPKMAFKVLSIVTLLILVSCGESKQEKNDITTKKNKLKALKKELSELQGKIITLQADIDKEENIDPKSRLKKVWVGEVKTKEFNHYIEVQGSVKSDKNVVVKPEISGVLIKKTVDKGQKVSKGQIICIIDGDLIQKNIEEVKKRLELVEEIYQRQENLWKQGIGSEIQYLQSKNDKESLEASLATLKTQQSKTKVKAPFSGILDEFFVNTGEMAAPSMPLARIINLNELKVSFDLSERYAKDFSKKDKVLVEFPALGIKKVVPISNIGRFIDERNRTFKAEVTIDNKDNLLRPNNMAVVRLNDLRKEKAITVPSHLLQKSAEGDKFLFTVSKGKNNTVAKKTVKIGETYAGYTVINSGLSESDWVVIKGYNEVTSEEEVNVKGKEDLYKSYPPKLIKS